MNEIETGDAVLHIPSGETWECGFVADGFLYNNGWPLGRTPITDFRLAWKTTPEKRNELLARMAAIQDKSDPRQRYAEALPTGVTV